MSRAKGKGKPRRDPAPWYQHFLYSLGTGWACDGDGLMHNRETGKVLVIEFKPWEWTPSRDGAQTEALQALCNIRVRAIVVRAKWPNDSKPMTPAQAKIALPPDKVRVNDIFDLKGEGKVMTHEEFKDYIDIWYERGTL